MRRALVATAGTVVGLVALLSYKSSGPINLQKVQSGSGQAGAAARQPRQQRPPRQRPLRAMAGAAGRRRPRARQSQRRRGRLLKARTSSTFMAT